MSKEYKELARDYNDTYLGCSTEVSPEFVELIINSDEDKHDGRSEWLWIELANGDRLLGCYPRGEVYEQCEVDW